MKNVSIVSANKDRLPLFGLINVPLTAKSDIRTSLKPSCFLGNYPPTAMLESNPVMVFPFLKLMWAGDMKHEEAMVDVGRMQDLSASLVMV